MQRTTGSTPDISPLLRFRWWEPVFYKLNDSDFPSESRECKGHFVGIAENVGHAMTFKILTDDTHKVIFWSNIQTALDPKSPNLRMDLLDGESIPPIIKSKHDSEDGEQDNGDSEKFHMPVFNPTGLVRHTFLRKSRMAANACAHASYMPWRTTTMS